MKPWLGIVTVSVEIPGAGSLKDRRQVVRSLRERLKKHFNVSCADLGPDATWNKADIAACCVGSSHQEVASRVEQLCSFVERTGEDGGFSITDMEYEVLAYGDF
ncbi:MAG: DUF503 domain-containing protein [Synergistaceae bacterium]|nr:DUF503 domain-containing protein [Synergistaceae bacterium]